MAQQYYRILVLDDEPRWRDFTRVDLGKAFSVDQADTVEAALQKLNQTHYDLIIASSAFNDSLRDISRHFPHLRIIVATGQPTVAEAIKMYRLGAFDYIPKDFRSDSLTSKIFDAMQKPVLTPA
jgi:DNA-binding NtrC family response regulator